MKRNSVFLSIVVITLCSVAAFAQAGKTPSVASVRDVDQPAKQPFTKLALTNFSDLVTVPAGKVLVVEAVSGNIVSTLGEVAPLTVYVMDYSLPGGQGVKQVHTLAPTFQTNNHKTFYTYQTRFYVPAGQTVYMFWLGDANPVSYMANVSGYFVDVQ